MNPTIGPGRLSVAALSGFLLFAASGASAQELSWTNSLETAGDDVDLVYTQLSLTAGGLGWKPVGSVSAYWVGVGDSDTYALTPAAGLRYRTGVGFVQAKVGYSFKNDDAIDFFGGGENGVVTNAHGEYWGDGTWGLQGIASHNWGSDYLWSRARVLRRVADVGDGAIALGGELVWQGETDEDEQILDDVVVERPRSSALQIGPVLQWVTGGPVIGAVSGGWKHNEPVDDSTWYLKLEFTISP